MNKAKNVDISLDQSQKTILQKVCGDAEQAELLKKHWFYDFSGAHPQPDPSETRCGVRTADCFSTKEGFIGNPRGAVTSKTV